MKNQCQTDKHALGVDITCIPHAGPGICAAELVTWGVSPGVHILIINMLIELPSSYLAFALGSKPANYALYRIEVCSVLCRKSIHFRPMCSKAVTLQ